jgi:hypothetical protein
MARLIIGLIAALVLVPAAAQAGWHHHHRYQPQVIYAAPPTYYVPMQGASGEAQAAPWLNIIAGLLDRFPTGGNPNVQDPVTDSALRADLNQLKADVAALGLRMENANSILQTQGKAIVDLQYELGRDGEIRRTLKQIKANTTRDNSSNDGDDTGNDDDGLENPESRAKPGNAARPSRHWSQQRPPEVRYRDDVPAGDDVRNR